MAKLQKKTYYKITFDDYSENNPLEISKHPDSEPWQDVTAVMNDKFVRVGNHVLAAAAIKIIEYVEV
jgi:hypothetical protein